MATFGKTDIGTTPQDDATADIKRCARFICPSNGLLTKITVYVGGFTTSGNTRAGIYNSGIAINLPNETLLATSTNQIYINDTDSPAWKEYTFSNEVISGGHYYWLTLQQEGGARLYFSGSVTEYIGHATDTYSDGLEDPFGPITPTYPNPNVYSIYATYTETAYGTGLGEINRWNRIAGSGFK